MKRTLSELLTFPKFYNAVKSQKLPLATAYKLAKLADKVNIELTFYREKLNQIVSEYSIKDESGNTCPTQDGDGIQIDPTKVAECEQRVEALAAFEVELPDYQFTLKEFGAIEIEPDLLATILPFIQE